MDMSKITKEQIEEAARKNHVPVSAFISAAVSEKVASSN